MIGGWDEPQILGARIDISNKNPIEGHSIQPCIVLAPVTREEYIDQQQLRGVLDAELKQSWSIANRAKYFYLVSVD